jgi:hypothetical protein
MARYANAKMKLALQTNANAAPAIKEKARVMYE